VFSCQVERYKESQEACQKVLEKEPENVKALFRYGKVLAIQGDLSEAVKHLQKALELNPDERVGVITTLHFLLSLIFHLITGDSGGAAEGSEEEGQGGERGEGNVQKNGQQPSQINRTCRKPQTLSMEKAGM
jgi:tetratricopeptide (TPR) repeat protein